MNNIRAVAVKLVTSTVSHQLVKMQLIFVEYRKHKAPIQSALVWVCTRRRGHLWQERFHSVVMDEQHLIATVRYIELNPVRARLCADPSDWRWSSVHAHLRGRDDEIVAVDPCWVGLRIGGNICSAWMTKCYARLTELRHDEFREVTIHLHRVIGRWQNVHLAQPTAFHAAHLFDNFFWCSDDA